MMMGRLRVIFLDLGLELHKKSDVTEAGAEQKPEWRQTSYIIQDLDLKKTDWVPSSSALIFNYAVVQINFWSLQYSNNFWICQW